MRAAMLARALTVACIGSGALVLSAGAARAQLQIPPSKVDLATFTCGELLASTGEVRDRILIYFNGYLDGTDKTTIWDTAVVGKRIDQVMRSCAASPKFTLLDAFKRAWSP
jgi:HdeA/HdeB family